MNMTAVQCANLLSALLGASGTIFLFFGSYAFQPLEGAPFNSPEVEQWNACIKTKNHVRKTRQKIGLGLLCTSFAVQALTVFLS